MNQYELIKIVIKFAPILIVVIAGLVLSKENRSIRITANFILGWISIIAFVFLYWHYAIEYAPSIEIKTELATKDGGAKTGSIFFGWIYSLILVCLFELFRWLTIVVNLKLKK